MFAKYHSEIEVFLKQDADKLPPHRPDDHEFRLLEGATPPFARNYKPMAPRNWKRSRNTSMSFWERASFALAPPLQQHQCHWCGNREEAYGYAPQV